MLLYSYLRGNSQMTTTKCEEFEVTSKQFKIAKKAIKVAQEYEKSFGRKLGITGEIGEVLACYKLGLRLCKNSQNKGYDAIDKDRKKVQIKAKSSNTKDFPTDHARIGVIRHECDYVLMVILARNYSITEVWKASFKKLKPILMAKQKRSGIPIGSFKKVAEKIYTT